MTSTIEYENHLSQKDIDGGFSYQFNNILDFSFKVRSHFLTLSSHFKGTIGNLSPNFVHTKDNKKTYFTSHISCKTKHNMTLVILLRIDIEARMI